jgi:hypothetical protein
MEEAREKIELFRTYYLVCFRSFDQDPYSPTHLEPLNMYIIVLREGILSVHWFSPSRMSGLTNDGPPAPAVPLPPDSPSTERTTADQTT